MNEVQQKVVPIRELLQDIHSNNEPRLPRGLVNPQLVGRITIYAALLCLLLATMTLLAMIWEIVDSLIAIRLIATYMILCFSLFVFRFINSQFD